MRRTLGRYEVGVALGRGGMGTVHLARERTTGALVALKIPNGALGPDPAFVAMYVDEARLAMRVRHANVVSPLDVVVSPHGVAIAFPYVEGESLAHLLRTAARRRERVPLDVVSTVVAQMLRGLAAAHEACDPAGEPLELVHRDVAPDNVLVGTDGRARLIDFGIAKAHARLAKTENGGLKGKLSYMAPEILRGGEPTRRSDVYSAGVLLWEALAARRLFVGPTEAAVIERVLVGLVEPPSAVREDVGPALDDVVACALAPAPPSRFVSAAAMADALEAAVPPAEAHRVGEWVRRLAGDALGERERAARALRASSRRWALGLAGVTAGAALGSLVFARAESPQPAARNEPAAALVTTAPPSLPPTPTPLSTPPLPAAPAAAERRAAGSGTAAAVPPRHGKAKRVDCTTPYFLDAQGRRVFRDECL